MGPVDFAKFPNKCPKCGGPAYLGFSKIECSNHYCEFYKKPDESLPPPDKPSKSQGDLFTEDYFGDDYMAHGLDLKQGSIAYASSNGTLSGLKISDLTGLKEGEIFYFGNNATIGLDLSVKTVMVDQADWDKLNDELSELRKENKELKQKLEPIAIEIAEEEVAKLACDFAKIEEELILSCMIDKKYLEHWNPTTAMSCSNVASGICNGVS